MSVAEKLNTLREKLGEVCDLRAAAALLGWDQETYMPPKAAPGRGQQLATLSALEHRLFTSDTMGGLLHDLTASDELDPMDAQLVAVTLYDYERATKLPEAFVHEMAGEQSKAYTAWVAARKDANWAAFEPHMAKIVALNQQKADYFGYEASPYDALLEEFERGMTSAQLKTVFGELAPKQSALVERIVNAPKQPDLAWLDGEWDETKKWDFTLRVLRDMGYDFDAGRQDRSVHPFSTAFGLYDVRVTTRSEPKELFSGLMGSIHEGGHALYMQGHLERDRRTPLLDGTSLGMHESQSRMWENVIGRSRAFWRHYAPVMRTLFPGRLDEVSAEQMYAAVNDVKRSLIRVEADECTYNLHIILRFEIEVALMEGGLRVSDVPALWNAKMKDYLGLDVPDDAAGCLQDIHWSHAALGYFPTYALGNLYAAQIFETIQSDLPGLWEQVEAGEFSPLREWLREHVHQHGRRKLAPEILHDITGQNLDATAYLTYLERKFSELYEL
jgi:carboxypeptidase Taq